MSHRSRRLIALVLSVWLLVLGAGVAAEIEHELGCVQLTDEGAGSGGGACSHGCSGHFGAHLLALGAERVSDLGDAGKHSMGAHAPGMDGGLTAESFYQPPRVSLT